MYKKRGKKLVRVTSGNPTRMLAYCVYDNGEYDDFTDPTMADNVTLFDYDQEGLNIEFEDESHDGPDGIGVVRYLWIVE